MPSLKAKPGSGCVVETKVIGQYSPQHSDWHVRRGAKMRIFSVLASRCGQQIESRFFSRDNPQRPTRRIRGFGVRFWRKNAQVLSNSVRVHMNPPRKGARHNCVPKCLVNASTQAGPTLRKNDLDGATKCEALHGTTSPSLNMIPRAREATVPLAERVYKWAPFYNAFTLRVINPHEILFASSVKRRLISRFRRQRT
jgi:hypothetical protein